MGQEIVYCCKCQIHLTGADLDKGKAFQVADRVSCAPCAQVLLKELSGRDRETLLGMMAKDRRPSPARSDSPRSGTRALPTRPGPKSTLGLSVGIGGTALVLALLVALSGGERRPRPPAEPEAVPKPKAAVGPSPGGQIAKELEVLDAGLRGPLDREDFKQALAFLQAAGTWRSEPEWAPQVEERVRRVREAAERALPALKEKAVAAARAGDVEGLKALRERMAASDFEAALAEVARPFQQAVDGLVVIEAEHFSKRIDRGGQAWTQQTMNGAIAMQALPDRSSPIQNDYAPRSPQLDYPVRFVRAGTHYVWIRGLATTDAANSMHIGLDGVALPGGTALSFSANSKWVWSKMKPDKIVAKVEVPSAGLHVINLWMREDGASLDRLLLTPNDTYAPEKEGPPESPR